MNQLSWGDNLEKTRKVAQMKRVFEADVGQFLLSKPAFPRPRGANEIRRQCVHHLLAHPPYTGMVRAPEREVSRRKGQHEALISVKTFQEIQDRFKGSSNTLARKDIGDDLALRGLAVLASCQTPHCSAYATSKTGKQNAYYRCHSKACETYGKSIRPGRIEGEFADLLRSLRPAAPATGAVRVMFAEAWEQHSKQAGELRTALKKQLTVLERQIDRFFGLLADAAPGPALKAYERKIGELEAVRLATAAQLDG